MEDENATTSSKVAERQVQDSSREFLHNYVNPLIVYNASNDGNYHDQYPSFRRNIEAYCTVRKPRRFSVPQIVVSETGRAYLVDMGNNPGAIQTTDLDDSDDGSIRSSYDSTTQSLLNHFDEGSFDEIDLSTSKDDVSPPSFEDDFVPDTVIENLRAFEDHFIPAASTSSYCTIRQKPKPIDPQQRLAATYGTVRLKQPIEPHQHQHHHEMRRVNTATSLDCAERVKDYLSELDSYLAELDDSTSSSDNSKSQVAGGNDARPTIESSCGENENNNNNNNGQQVASVKLRRSNKEQSRTLPKQHKVNGTIAAVQIADDATQFRRSISLRQPTKMGTWSSPSTSAETHSTSCSSDRKSKRNFSWLRNSMRKTKPIEIPEQDLLPVPAAYTNDAFQYNEIEPTTTYNNLQSTDESTTDSFNSFNTVYFDANACDGSFPYLTVPLPPHEEVDDHATPQQSSSAASAMVHQPTDMLREEDIMNVILNTSTESATSTEESPRPRQLGRRSDGRLRVVSIDVSTPEIRRTAVRPISAPTRVHLEPPAVSEDSSMGGSTRNASPISLVSSIASSSATSAVENQRSRPRRNQQRQNTSSQHEQNSNNSSSSNGQGEGHEEDEMCGKQKWPHLLGRTMATFCCTVGLFNISRFAIFSIHFGANFIVQFLILSFFVGIPMLWLQMTLGASIGGSPIGMWYVSPICKGIGIALLVAHGITTLYSAISLGWVLIYLRDTFIPFDQRYRWEETFELYRGPSSNSTYKLSETVADYFNGVVLQRLHLGGGRSGPNGMGGVRFHLAFNLAIIWMLIFIILCRGIRSYGRFILGLSILPILGLIVVSSKLISVLSFDSIQNIFPATDWSDFFLNSHSWVSAAQETFLTWGLLGVSVYSIYCNSSRLQHKLIYLRRDALIVVILTIFVLVLSAVFASACVNILNTHGYYYFPGSFENMGSYVFLLPTDRPLPSQLATTPSKWLTRYSTVLGESFRKFSVPSPKESGYQVLRLVTELLPSTLAAASHELIPPVIAMLAYLTLLLFGVAQLATMWKPLASLLGESPSGILLSCVTALFLGIPLATESGISIIHFLDTVIGGAWWLLLLWFAHILAIFLVRGRPYTSDLLSQELRFCDSFSAFIAFSWNVLLPVALMILCIIEYRLSNVYDFFHWRGSSYWPLWSRQVAGIIQTLFLLIVPIACIVQIYRYLSKGPPDILERIEALYRPVLRGDRDLRHPPVQRTRPPNVNHTVITLEGQPNTVVQVDEPPKYTPPPSYTTATGIRIAKMLRQSIRRSVRRILGEPSRRHQNEAPPPDYAHQQQYVDTSRNNVVVSCIEMGPRPMYNSATMERRHRSANGAPAVEQSQPVQPQDVALLLRPSHLLSFSRTMSLGDAGIHRDDPLNRRHSRSVEDLVLTLDKDVIAGNNQTVI